MGKVYWLTCPACQFEYYVGHELLALQGFPTVCPKCHHEYDPHDSAKPIRETS